MSTTSQPPAPSKWAMEAAKETFGLFCDAALGLPHPMFDESVFASIIRRHHAAAQAKTVALLEDLIALADQAMKESNNDGGEYDRDEILKEYRTHLTQLKEGAP